MKLLPTLFIAVLACSTGCVSKSIIHDADFSPWIFPSSYFESEAECKFNRFWNGRDLFETMSDLFGPEIIKSIEADPYHCQKFRAVCFRCPTPRLLVVRYYEDLFASNGWTKVRDMLPSEDCNTWADQTVHVYQKDKALVRMRFVAPDDRYVDGGFESNIIDYFITFSFININPSDFLGPHYRDKGQERFSTQYHIGTVELLKLKITRERLQDEQGDASNLHSPSAQEADGR